MSAKPNTKIVAKPPAVQPLYTIAHGSMVGASPPSKPAPVKTYQQLSIEQGRIVDDFVKYLTEMITDLYSKNPRDEDFNELRDRYMLAQSTIPAVVMKNAGGRLWKYREHIARQDAKFLLAQDFVDDVADIKQTLPERENFDRFPEVLQKIKLTWHTLSEAERGKIFTRANTLLTLYASWEQNRRALEKHQAKSV